MKNTTYQIGRSYYQLTITNFSEPKEYPCTSEAEMQMLLDDKIYQILQAGFRVEMVIDEPDMLRPCYEVWDGDELVGGIFPHTIDAN